MTALQAIITAILQGITELFPVSSLGHAVILPKIFGWAIDQHAADFLPFLVVLHSGTAVALLAYFWRDWFDFGMSLLGRKGERAAADRKLFWLIVLATLPAVVTGFAFRKILGDAFGSPAIAAAFLIVNGFILFIGEKLRKEGRATGTLDDLTWKGALAIGAVQCAALIPGISRSGVTMVGGILAGLHHRDSARFSFLLATPIIIGATVLEAPKLLRSDATLGSLAVLSGVVAGVVAFVSIVALMRYFKAHDFEALNPFAYYCWIAGALSLSYILVF